MTLTTVRTLLVSSVSLILLISAASPAGARADGDILLHSHNDYQHSNPLEDALNLNFESVEADIWLLGENIIVAHYGFDIRGTLEHLYLNPLRRRIQETGSVYGDGKTFYLWIDLKESSPALLERLHEALSRYDFFTEFTDDGIIPGAVTAILTGNDELKTRYVNEFPVRKATRDSNDYSTDDPDGDASWAWYALDWKRYFTWDATDPIPIDEWVRLDTMMQDIRNKNRRVRFWNTPQNDLFWSVLLSAGVEIIGTDYLKKLRCFVYSSECRWLPFRPFSSGSQSLR